MEPTQNERPEERPHATTRVRRPYTAPQLVEYGSVAKLTQGSGATANGDGGQMMRL
jgi:hypothetical protein